MIQKCQFGGWMAVSVLLGAPIAALATPPDLLWCNGCTAASKSAAAKARPSGVVYVGDTTANNIVAYNVYLDTIDTVPPQHVKLADSIAPTNPYKDFTQAMIDFYRTAPVGWSKAEGIPYHTGNVYDVVNPGVAQNNMTDYFYNNSFAATFAPRMIGLAAAMHLVDNNAVPRMTVRVTFDDGSRLDLIVDLTSTDTEFQIRPLSARDSHNNNVPGMSNPSGGVGTYNFNGPGNGNDYQSFLQNMALLGFVMNLGGSGIHGIACTESGVQQARHCERY